MDEDWITVDETALESDAGLQHWIEAALKFHAHGSGKQTKTKKSK